MIRFQADIKLLQRVTRGDQEAMDFLANQWSPYVHEIDDIIDGDRRAPEAILCTFARAAMLYSHPFYLKHLPALRQLVLVINNLYADSVAWENSPLPWRRDWADHNRHAGMEMVIAVAQICGGYEHARAISQEQRSICWNDHHDQKGKAI
jgi:hypothetical protein